MKKVTLNEEEREIVKGLIDDKLLVLEEDELEFMSYGDPEQYKKALEDLYMKLDSEK